MFCYHIAKKNLCKKDIKKPENFTLLLNLICLIKINIKQPKYALQIQIFSSWAWKNILP